MSASAIPPVTACTASSSLPRKLKERIRPVIVPRQTEQRRQRDERIHDDEEAAGAFDLDAGGDLERALERSVLVIQTVPEHAQTRDRASRGPISMLR